MTWKYFVNFTVYRTEFYVQATGFASFESGVQSLAREPVGQRFVLNSLSAGAWGGAMFPTSWIALSSEEFPRLAASHVLHKEAQR
jgi:hypothetical protein